MLWLSHKFKILWRKLTLMFLIHIYVNLYLLRILVTRLLDLSEAYNCRVLWMLKYGPFGHIWLGMLWLNHNIYWRRVAQKEQPSRLLYINIPNMNLYLLGTLVTYAYNWSFLLMLRYGPSDHVVIQYLGHFTEWQLALTSYRDVNETVFFITLKSVPKP